MADILKKFGRYFLLDHIAQGGMAEIYRARLASTDGAGRLIVIKKVIANLGANEEFLKMFRSEIKVTMGFNHPNIVQLYDFGEEDSQPFIAMEWVDGKNLKQFISRSFEFAESFPIELAVYIIEQAAAGLHYANSFKDKITGEALNVVHRDISPQNLLISYEGNVKIIDFGIAKATNNIEATRTGVIKGKPSYLSPEQISGEILDGRSDIFALGAVFWELLTGKKLFAGENDLAVLKLIESAQTHVKPPSTINPNIPKELDYIVLRSLAKQREKRFQTAEEMQRALHKFLYSYMPEFNPSDLGYFAKDLFKNEIVEDRKKIQKLNEKVESLLILDQEAKVAEREPSDTKKSKEDTTTMVDAKKKSGQIRAPERVYEAQPGGFVEIEATPNAFIKQKSPSQETSSSGSSLPKLSRGKPLASLREQVKRVAGRDQTSSGGGFNFGTFLLMTAVVVIGLYMYGPDFGIEIPYLSEGKKEKPHAISENSDKTERVTPETVVQQDLELGKTILLRLNIVPLGSNTVITLNGKPISNKGPQSVINLDSPYELVIETPGYQTLRREFTLAAKQVSGLREWMMDVNLDPVHFGFVTIHTTPSADAIITMEGGTWRRKTPLENEKLPVGDYKVKLINEILGMEKNVDLTVKENKAITIDTRLEIK